MGKVKGRIGYAGGADWKKQHENQTIWIESILFDQSILT